MEISALDAGSSGMHDYGISASAWRRAARMIGHYGIDHALQVADERAEGAFARGDMSICLRWRAIMTGLHAVGSDVVHADERVH